MDVVIKLCVAFAMLHMLKGLKIAPSTGPVFDKFYNAMSNLTISCSEENLIHLDWHKDTSDLSSCSANAEPYCLPGGRYTYENGSFNMMLINMKSGDCGRYTCKTYTGSKSFDLHLIDRVKAFDIVENSHSITMKTNCVYPSNTVKIQWFYIHEDGLPAGYNKPASRSEEKGNCTGTCWGNTVLQISSTLELPTEVKNPIQVKLMMYVEQGGDIMKKTSTKLYTIERCLPPGKDGFILVICLAIVFMLVDTINIICMKRRKHSTVNTGRHGADQRKSGDEENNSEERQVSTSGALYQQTCTDAILVFLVSCVILICSIILMMLKHETKIPDIDGNCPDDVHATNTTTVVVIAFAIIAIMVHWKLIIWANRNVISILRNRNKNKTDDGENGELQKLTTGDNSLSDREEPGCSRNVEVKTANSETIKGTEELKRTSEELCQLETTPCNQSLTCWPSSVNEVLINVGGSAELTCNLDLKDFRYPSWQAPDGKVINYGGKEKFEDEFKDYKWGTDKTSIVISKVNVSHAGIYVCFSPDGKVQTLTLVVALPTKKIEVSEKKTVHLDPDLTSTRPAWRRLTNIVPEQFNTVHDERIEIRDDKKSILIKKCKIQDTGFYEVVGNNVTQRFELLVKNDEYTDRAYTIDQGSTIRLHSSSTEDYPSWECLGKGVFNYGGEENFRLKESSRFLWSVDKKSLMIVGILKQDTGTYICRHANGFVETVTIIVKGKPHLIEYKEGKEKNILIPHETGYLLPSVVSTDVLGSAPICHQNYESTKFNPAKTKSKNICHLPVHGTSISSFLEFSAYHRPIHTFQFKKV